MLQEYLIRFGEINDTALKRAKAIGNISKERETFLGSSVCEEYPM